MRILKRIVEMIFIFLVPLMLLLFGLKINKVYDENNNLTSQYLTYENGIFREYNDNLDYINYINFKSLNNVYLPINNETSFYRQVYVNNNIPVGSTFIFDTPFYLNIQIWVDNEDFSSEWPIANQNAFRIDTNSSQYVKYTFTNYTKVKVRIYPNDNILSRYGSTYNYFYVNVFDITNSELIDKSINNFKLFVKNQFYDIGDYTEKYLSDAKYSNNFEYNYTWYNKALISLSDHLQFNNNFMIQFIFIYVIFIMLNLLLWYVFYVPFDMLFGLLFRKLEYYK